jgi:hypothetical protein
VALAPVYSRPARGVLLSDLVSLLRRRAWSRDDVAAILGGNLLGLLKQPR